MDKEVSQALAKVFEYIINSLGGIVEEKGNDTLEYIKTLGSEIVAYKLSIAYMWEVVAAVALILGIVFIIMACIKTSEECAWLAALFIVIAFVIALINGYTIIECKTFPEKVILEYVEDLYGSNYSSR